MKYDDYCDSEAAQCLILDEYEENIKLYPELVKKVKNSILLGNPKIDALLLFAEINVLVAARKRSLEF